MGTKRVGLARIEALLENLKREIDLSTSKLKFSDAGLGSAPTTIFKWDYISCPTPIVSNLGLSAHGVLADGDLFSMIFPGPNMEMYPAQCSIVGAHTAAGQTFMTVGTIPATDTNGTAAGLDLRGDTGTADNLGLEMILGGTQFGGASACTVGTHAVTIDATFYAVDWTDNDCVSVGFRKVQEFDTGHGAIIAAASGDPIYTDFALCGVQSDDDVQLATALNDGSGAFTDSTDATAAAGNHRFKMSITANGVMTYQHVGEAVMDAGTLADPTATAAFTFDDGDVIVPYLVIQKKNIDQVIALKSITVTRELADGTGVPMAT